MGFTINDLQTIIEALDDMLIIYQAVSLTHRSEKEKEEIKRRIKSTTRTKVKLLLMIKEALEE